MARQPLIEHLITHALRTDGPFTLRSGEVSDWYLDARRTTFDGEGAWHTGRAVLERLDPAVEAVGGMTMGADPVSIATVMAAEMVSRRLRAFSIRKTEKDHGTGGRVVGPVASGDRAAIIEDTTTTGGAAIEATQHALEFGLDVVQAIALVDRSDGSARLRFEAMGIPYVAILVPTDLGMAR